MGPTMTDLTVSISNASDPRLAAAFDHLYEESPNFRDMMSHPRLNGYDAIELVWGSSDVNWVARSGPERRGDTEVFEIELNTNYVSRTTGLSRRALTVEELIAHEVGHGTFPPRARSELFSVNEEEEHEIIKMVNGVRRDLGIPLRDLERPSLRPVPVENANTIDSPTSFWAHRYHMDNPLCFLAGTAVEMWPTDPSIQPDADGTYDESLVRSRVWMKIIENVREGDVVLSYDDAGNLKPGRVKRTFQNEVSHILDFWGTGVTPGHAYLCGDGKYEGQHLPLIDILRQDAAIVSDNGVLVRASTNCEVGSIGDRLIHASACRQSKNDSESTLKTGKARFGTRVVLPDGRHTSFMDMARSQGWGLSDDGYMVAVMRTEEGPKQRKFLFPWAHGDELPKPEDYVLHCSDVTLSEIYAAGEWERIGTPMAPPASSDNATATSSGLGIMQESFIPAPNIPPAFLDHPDAPITTAKLNRKQRKAAEAHRRKSSGTKARQLH